MARIEITTAGIEQVIGQLMSTSDQIERATKRAIAKATQYAATEVRRGLAASLGVPQKVLTTRKRIATRPGLVWIGIVPIKAAYLGTPRQTKAGAKVGRRSYPGAFVAKMPTGHIGVFRRVGKSRLPIREVTEPLTGASQIVETVRQKTASRLPELFRQELNYEVNVRGRG